jgi:hypothetical protein
MYRKIEPVWAMKMHEDFHVKTLEGDMEGHNGDYLCRGIEGELWPCKASIFEKTYVEAKPE